MEFYDKFVDRFQDMPKVKIPAVSKCQRSRNYLEPSKENVLCEYDGVILTMFYLKILLFSQNSLINFSDAGIIS